MNCDLGYSLAVARLAKSGLDFILHRTEMPKFPSILLIAALASASTHTVAAQSSSVIDTLVDMSLEELLQVEITSLGRKSQRLADVAAAVHVITREDIRRSGATSLPEVLRLAPGVDAARISDNRWSVSIRGFSGRWANKLLVLVDGRSLYTPLYSGVEWEQENIPLSLIERIEVIRGPAAATWGANAVSGVINIITLPASETPGLDVELAAGGQQFRGLTASKGVEIDADTHLRVFATGDELGPDERVGGGESNTGSHRVRAGMRLDKGGIGADYTLISEFWRGWSSTTNIAGLPIPDPRVDYDTRVEGGFVLGRREGKTSGGLHSSLQASLEHVYDENTLGWSMQRNTLDLDYHLRHTFASGADLTWGAGYRLTRDRMGAPTASIAYSPLERTLSTLSLYAQGDIPLVGDQLRLSLGGRLEDHSYTGWEFQPNARLLWHASEASSAWVSASRAVRTPNRTERDAQFSYMWFYNPGDPMPFPSSGGNAVIANLLGSDKLKSETLDAFELGYRVQVTPRLSVDLAAYLHRYDDLRTAVFEGYVASGMPGILFANTVLANILEADVRGFEISADWHPRQDWQLALAYSHAVLKLNDDSLDIVEDLEGSLPPHILSLRSSHDLDPNLKLDLWLRHVGERDATHVSGRRIPAYTSLDARLAWTPRKNLEISLVGQNLLDASHQEFANDIFTTVSVVIERRAYAQARWRF